jgi:hypothetical protein
MILFLKIMSIPEPSRLSLDGYIPAPCFGRRSLGEIDTYFTTITSPATVISIPTSRDNQF